MGLELAIKTMKKGEKAIIIMRPDYGYGYEGFLKIPAFSTLIYCVDFFKLKWNLVQIIFNYFSKWWKTLEDLAYNPNVDLPSFDSWSYGTLRRYQTFYDIGDEKGNYDIEKEN